MRIDQDKVRLLNQFQNSGFIHPYTCDKSAAQCVAGETGEAMLIATGECWVCPCGKYRQNYNEQRLSDLDAILGDFNKVKQDMDDFWRQCFGNGKITDE